MFVLHIELQVKPGQQQVLEKIYVEDFQPAISGQSGFRSASLLRPADDGAGDYLLSLTFDQQTSQQKWVSTDIHQQVWPQIESQCLKFSVKPYNTL
ncbi:MAG: antibiotic biosynthesis monooxygenase family protein [Edaphobacter sp.]